MVSRTVRLGVLVSLLLVTPAGFLFKLYGGPGRGWFGNYGAGLLYEVFWILVFALLFPSRRASRRIPIWVFTCTCALEFMQLWHAPLLERVRSTFPGRALIGSTFSWTDFPHYAAGCIIGWLWLRLLFHRSETRTRPDA